MQLIYNFTDTFLIMITFNFIFHHKISESTKDLPVVSKVTKVIGNKHNPMNLLCDTGSKCIHFNFTKLYLVYYTECSFKCKPVKGS